MKAQTKKCFQTLLMVSISTCLFATPGMTEDAGQPAGLVARKDYDTGKNWQPRQIMGRDFWHMLEVNEYTQPEKGLHIDGMRELWDQPLYKESGLIFQESLVVPGSNKVSMAMDPHKFIEARTNAPFFIIPDGVRPIYRLMKKFEYDHETYNAWKNAHPNFMGCVNGETDNDFLCAAPWGDYSWPKFKADLEKTGDKELAETIEREFPKPQNREELTAQYMKACKAFREFSFNDADKIGYMCAAHCHNHYYCESGSGMVWLETTNTGSPEGRSNYRHQVSLFFIRGAARQYNNNWVWYIAADYNGYDDKGKFSFSGPDYCGKAVSAGAGGDAGGFTGPGCGMSPSLCARDMFLAYLSGASFVIHERWFAYLCAKRKDGKWDKLTLASPFGKALEDWFEFTRKNPERGASYAPVALLVPFDQGYLNSGGKSWGMFKYERTDWMIDAFMYTIMPHSPVTTNGNEGALANSPYGDIYDVIVPNTPEKPVSLDVLNKYKVALVLGKYPKSKALAERLMEYVENGGTLLLNIKQVNEFFPAKFLGFKRATVPRDAKGMSAVKVKGPVRSTSDGKTFALPTGYEMEDVKLQGAFPLLKDARGDVLACKNIYGKGNVIVSTVDCLVPKSNNDDETGHFLDKMVYRKKFPFIEYFLNNIVNEVLPLEVRGDIEYGMNKLPDGWLLYLINNKGVTKFTNKEQILDISKTAKVEVALRSINASAITELREQKTIQKDDKTNSFTVDVPPGDIKVVRIKI